MTDRVAPASASLRRVGINAFSLLAAYALPRVFTVGAILVAARLLGAERFGSYATASAFAVILAVVGALGMHPLLVRDLARDPRAAPRLLRAAHAVKVGSGVLLLVLAWALSWSGTAVDRELVVPSMLLCASWVVAAFAENFSAYYQAIERMHVWTEASALMGIVTGTLGAVLVLLTRSVAWFCVAPLAGQLAALGWMIHRAPPEVRRGEAPRLADVLRLVRAVAPFTAAFVALTFHYKLDVLLMQRWRGDADVGIYSAAYKFVDVFHALVIVAIGALYPRLARSAPRGGGPAVGAQPTWWAGARTAELCLLTALAVGGFLHISAPAAIRLGFGSAYAPSAVVLAWLALALPALALNLLGSFLFGATHRMRWAAAAYGAGLVLKTGLDVLLIPRLGPVGAAQAMAIAEIALAIAVVLALAKAHANPGARALVAAGIAASLIPLARMLHDPTDGLIAASVWLLAVLAVYGLAGVVDPTERLALKAAIRPGSRGTVVRVELP